VRENLMHGSMRGGWKPGMVAGTETPPERDGEHSPGTCSHGACLLLYNYSPMTSNSFRLSYDECREVRRARQRWLPGPSHSA